MENSVKKSFNKRGFVSVAMTVSLILLPLSGYMNHYLQFEPFSTARHYWMAVHNAAAVLFVIFSLTHIIYNRKLLMNYVKKVKTVLFTKEAALAVMLILFIVGFISMHTLHVH